MNLVFASSDGQDSRQVQVAVNASGPRPTIADPPRVSTAGGDLVTLTMRTDDRAAEDLLSYSVTFSGEPGTVVSSRVIDDSRGHVELDVITPAHPAGFVEIVVTAPNGRFGVLDQTRGSLEGTLLERNDGTLAGDLAGVLDGSPITVRFAIDTESASGG